MTDPPPTPLASTRGELRQLRRNSQATVADLKAFLAELKGRSPQEMLGMVAGQRLFRATLQAVALVGAILLAGTIVPYLNRDSATVQAVEPQKPAAPASEAAKPEAAPAGAPTPAAADAKVLENLGVNEEKAAPPDVNPLDADDDDFLEELE